MTGGGTMCPTLGLIGWLQWFALGLKRWSLIGAAKVDLSFDNVEAHVMLYLTNKVLPYKINLKITCKISSYWYNLTCKMLSYTNETILHVR